MTVESNYTTAIATLCDWLKNLGPMTVESNYTTAIATLCDWLKNLEPMAVESNYAVAIATLCDWLKNLGIARISDWFIAQFTPVMIGRRNYLANGFSMVIWTTLYRVLIPIIQPSGGSTHWEKNSRGLGYG